ncbi:FAD-dependent monooxygenase [Ramlibacter sp. H39-3-26]|uniref:FAD-dependent monooxygenase n=1 Tax=Curvibacter soli TaxID=3031331 RepID=UPI0023DAF117|nr:FAD-dependent monooxygenase [Ramlibacter sp. H39-3-26]MDF1484756.1 FAD-dependent monooxygenase [Ramlibacter sp. H39-3-26]
MAHPFDVCIRGSGIVGRTLALLLARDRLRVALAGLPRPPAAQQPDVRAYALNAASRTLLQSLRCWPDEGNTTAVREMHVQVPGGVRIVFRAEDHRADALAWIVDVPALELRLEHAVAFQPMVEALSAPAPAALTVACEGRTSSTRQEFGVEFNTVPYRQQAIATRLECEHPHSGVARQWFLPLGGVLAFLPLGGPQGNSVAVVWSVPQEQALELLALDAGEFSQRLETASQHAAGSLRLAGERQAWPLQHARARKWTGSWQMDGELAGWALAGDAAHNVHPLAGQGLNLGLGDAAELATVLHGKAAWRSVGDPHLLRRYERARKTDILPMGLASDMLQQLFARHGSTWQALRDWGMRGFEYSGPVKGWMTQHAMGLR